MAISLLSQAASSNGGGCFKGRLQAVKASSQRLVEGATTHIGNLPARHCHAVPAGKAARRPPQVEATGADTFRTKGQASVWPATCNRRDGWAGQPTCCADITLYTTDRPPRTFLIATRHPPQPEAPAESHYTAHPAKSEGYRGKSRRARPSLTQWAMW